METIVSQLSGIARELRVRKFEAVLLGSSILTCLVGSILLTISFTAAASGAKSTYPEAPNLQDLHGQNEHKGGAGEIMVDIAGAVNRPGLYRLPQTARLNDLLQEAQGLSQQANHQYASRSLNLAQALSDQQKVYIPGLGEEVPDVSSQVPSSAIVQNTTNGLSEGPLLNVNEASKDELMDLPGIGEITAEKIIDGRPYTSIEELSKNGVIKKNIFAEIRQKISI